MIEQIYAYFTIEILYFWVNLGVLPFWLILIFFPSSNINKFFVTSILPILLLSGAYIFANIYAPLSNKIGKIEVTKNLFIFDEGKKINISQNGNTPKFTQK